MRKLIGYLVPTVAAAIILTVLLVAATGCHLTPRQQYASVQETYITSVELVVAAYVAGEIDRDVYVEKVLPAIRKGDAALDVYNSLTALDLDASEPKAVLLEVLAVLQPFIVESP